MKINLTCKQNYIHKQKKVTRKKHATYNVNRKENYLMESLLYVGVNLDNMKLF